MGLKRWLFQADLEPWIVSELCAQSVPASLVETHEVSSITMQYRRECGPSDVLQSLTSPADQHELPEVLRPFEDHTSGTQASDLNNCNSDLNSSSSSSSATIDNQCSEVIGDDDGSEWQFSSVERTLLTAFSSNPSWLNYEPFHFAHLLRTQRGAAEIVRGKTIWKLKKSSHIQANELWNPNPYPTWWALKSKPMSNLSIKIIHSTQLYLLVQHFQRLVP